MTTMLSRNGTRQPQLLKASLACSGRAAGTPRRRGSAGLHALQREARIEAAPAERRVLEDHRARARDLAGDREALDQAQHDQQRRREQADLVVGRQEADQHGRAAHQEHADDEHALPSGRVAPVAENERADRPAT
jgi:hypothetical protein